MTLQHLRSGTANKRPTPAGMSDGQLAMNTNSTSPGLFLKDGAGNLVKVGPVHVGTTAPNASPATGGSAGNTVGEQWLDTSGSTYVFKIWDGSAWRSEAGEFVNATGDVMTGALVMDNQQQVRFRETTANGTNFIALQAPASVAADKTITLPDVTGTVVTTGDTGTVTSTMLADGTIVNADVNASAAIAGTKISPDFGSQNRTSTGTSTAASFIPTSSTAPSNGLYLSGTNTLALATASTERMRIDSAGRASIGVAAAVGVLTLAEPSTDGEITLRSSGGVGLNNRARIVFGYQSGGSNYGGYLAFNTTSFSNVNTEAARITSDGYVRLSSNSPGIQFGGNTAAANALDDYEEGTFTPSIVGTSTAGTATYVANGRVGRYTKIGNRVFFDLYLSWTAHTGTGNLEINGLPFTVQNTTNLNRNYTAIFSGVALTAGNIGAAYTAPGSDGIALRQMPTGGGSVAVIPMDTSAQISISGCFDAA
jgi:hypothetical protein